jgi:hypothetical protein
MQAFYHKVRQAQRGNEKTGFEIKRFLVSRAGAGCHRERGTPVRVTVKNNGQQAYFFL